MTAAPSDPELRLAAFDADDLSVISAHLQDSLVRVGDMAGCPSRTASRSCSRGSTGSRRARACERATTGLHFDRVRTVRQCDVPQTTPNVILELLAISF